MTRFAVRTPTKADEFPSALRLEIRGIAEADAIAICTENQPVSGVSLGRHPISVTPQRRLSARGGSRCETDGTGYPCEGEVAPAVKGGLPPARGAHPVPAPLATSPRQKLLARGEDYWRRERARCGDRPEAGPSHKRVTGPRVRSPAESATRRGSAPLSGCSSGPP